MTTVEVVPAPFNLRFTRGDDFSIELTFRDDEGELLDLSDSTFRAQLRRRHGAGTAISFTVDDSDKGEGKVRLDLTHDVTKDFVTQYVWDLERVFTADGAVQTILAGEITVDEDVTRA